MAWSQSIFLQALGWATLNSFWQMGLLWCAYQLTSHFFRPTSNQKYLQAVYSLSAGAAWFAWTFFSFYSSGRSAFAFLEEPLFGGQLLPVVLTAASLTYLILLIVPTVNVYRNWRYLQAIRQHGLEKAPVKLRMFVDRIAAHIGIRKTVRVFLSSLVTSPLTVGYLKPVILVPVASLNNLSAAQLEAVLLHELSHIRRYDYLVNLFVTALNVVLYYNPFVRLFIRAVEAERENCCDELVLQFEYDKVGYASALLELEKSNHRDTALAMGATKGNNLLLRIERIVGIQKKPRLNVQHLMGAFAALMLLFALNSLVIASREPANGFGSYSGSAAPYAFLQLDPNVSPWQPARAPVRHVQPNTQPAVTVIQHSVVAITAAPLLPPSSEDLTNPVPDPTYRTVAFDESSAHLSNEQRSEVASAVTNARKLLEVQWTEVEKNIPDGLTAGELEMARRQYLSQVEALNWQRLEQNLQNNYGQGDVDLTRINSQMNQQIALARLDSVQGAYRMALSELEKINTDSRSAATPLPDVSVSELRKVRQELQQKIARIDDLKGKKDKKGSVKL